MSKKILYILKFNLRQYYIIYNIYVHDSCTYPAFHNILLYISYIRPFSSRKCHPLEKSPRYPTCPPRSLPLNPHDLQSLGPKVGSLATARVPPSVPGGSAKPSHSRRQLPPQPQQLQRRRRRPIRVLLWTTRDLRALMVLNTATERAVWGVISSMETARV